MGFQKGLIFFGVLIATLHFIYGQRPADGRSRYLHREVFPKISKAILALGRNVLNNLEANGKNTLISPANIYHALCVLHLGAAGKSLQELSNILGLPADRNYSKLHLHSSLSDYYQNVITSDSSPAVVKIADAVFLQDNFPVKKNYTDNVKKYYNSDIENINFGNGKEAVKKINGWVADKTKDRIKKVVDEDALSDAIALIVSTLYFNGKWAKQFPKHSTKTEKFFTTDEQEIDVSMMNLVDHFLYVDDKELQFESVDLPYENSEYSLNIILPYPKQTLKNLTQHLNNTNIKELMNKANTYMSIDVKLPKMKFSNHLSLVEVLKALGVQDIFSAADLTDMTDAKVKISKMYHDTEIEIDEEGTIATAVTIIVPVPASAWIPPRDPKPFHVNRPFILNIYHRRISTVLFSGVVYQPKQ